MTNSDAVPPASAPAATPKGEIYFEDHDTGLVARRPVATPGEPLRISDDERARLPKLGVPDDTMVEGISHPPLRPEVQAELDAFREHLTWHREDSAPDCRFCTERDAKKRPAATPEPDTFEMAGDVLSGTRRIEDVLAELRPAVPTAAMCPECKSSGKVIPYDPCGDWKAQRCPDCGGSGRAAPTGEEAETLKALRDAAEVLRFHGGDPLADDLDAIASRLTAQATELAALRARVEELETPDSFWLADDPEVYASDPQDFADGEMIGVGEVAEILTGRSLPTQWAAHICIPETETSDEDSEVQLFATEAEARAALAPRQTTTGVLTA